MRRQTPRFYEHYSLLNCMTECQANYTFTHCGCNMYFQVEKKYNFHSNPFKAYGISLKVSPKKQFGFSTKMKTYQWANQSCCFMKFFSKRVSRRLIDIFHFGTEQHFYCNFLSHDCGTRACVAPTRWIASMKVLRSVLLPFFDASINIILEYCFHAHPIFVNFGTAPHF